MHRTWQVQAGHLLCVWSEVAQHVGYSARWMKEASDTDVPSGYLPPFQTSLVTVFSAERFGFSPTLFTAMQNREAR